MPSIALGFRKEVVTEAEFAKRVSRTALGIVGRLQVAVGAPLLYQVTVNHNAEITVDPGAPKRGRSAFETDVAVFEPLGAGRRKPRVVVECKLRLTTHDVLTYSTKARRHKQIYPYLRYGMMIANEQCIPRRFFTHNEALDFCVCAHSISDRNFTTVLSDLLMAEIRASEVLEQAAFGIIDANVYRTDVSLARRSKRRLRG
jgi:hypothetical protein